LKEGVDPGKVVLTPGPVLENFWGGNMHSRCLVSSSFYRVFFTLFLFSLIVVLLGVDRVQATPAALGCWYSQTDMPTARRAAAAAAHGGYVYVMGGRDDTLGQIRFNTVERYDPAADSWTTMTPMPTARAWLVAATVGDKIYAIGGSNSSSKLSVVEEYDPATNSWTTKTAMPTARDDSVIGVVDDVIYVIGGWNGQALDAVEAYDPATDTWTVRNEIPEALALAGSGVIDGKIHVVGGFQDAVLQTHFVYDPVTDSWSSLADIPTRRSRTTAGVVNGNLIVFGGYNPSLGWLDLVELYDPVTSSWSTMNSMPTRRGDITGDIAGGQVYLFGGRNQDGGPMLHVTESVDFNCTNNPPDIPENPDPGVGWSNQPWDTVLSWDVDDADPGDTLNYDVYFGTETIPPLVSAGQTADTYTPPTLLLPYTWYNWQIVARDNHEAVTAGPRWRFKSGGPGDQIKNGGFESDLANWGLETTGGAHASLVRDTNNPGTGGAAARITVDSPGNSLDRVQFSQSDLGQVAGRIYVISFQARANRTRPLQVVLRQTPAPGTEYETFTVNVTPAWQTFEYRFTAAGSQPELTLQFNLGRHASAVWLDQIKLEDPSLLVEKSPAVSDIPEPGGVVRFDLSVTNNSADSVWLDALTDVPYGDVTNPGNPEIVSTSCDTGGRIRSGRSYTCDFRVEITGEPGVYADSVTAVAGSYTAVDEAEVTITDALPEIGVELTAVPELIDEPGGLIDFTLEIENNSVERIWLTALTETHFGNLTNPSNPNLESSNCELVAINTGANYSCAFRAAIDEEPGLRSYQISAAARDNEENYTTENGLEQITIVDVLPAITAFNVVDPAVIPETGGWVTYTIGVSNEGVETLTLTSLVDSLSGALHGQGTCALPADIPVGGEYSCAYYKELSGEPDEVVSSTVVATAVDNELNSVQAYAENIVAVADVEPTYALNIVAAPSAVVLSGPITYTVAVENQSGEQVTLQSLIDDTFGDLHGQGDCALPQVVDGFAQYNCTFTVSLSGHVGETVANRVVATAVDDENNIVQKEAGTAVEILGNVIFLPILVGN
jgi:N-acetylneuraminic acid mutarotase